MTIEWDKTAVKVNNQHEVNQFKLGLPFEYSTEYCDACYVYYNSGVNQLGLTYGSDTVKNLNVISFEDYINKPKKELTNGK